MLVKGATDHKIQNLEIPHCMYELHNHNIHKHYQRINMLNIKPGLTEIKPYNPYCSILRRNQPGRKLKCLHTHKMISLPVFTRGQFWPSGIVVACVCVSVCVCLCVNHEFVRAITLRPFKLESPNLEHRCKTPWLRSLLFCGVIDLDLQGQI